MKKQRYHAILAANGSYYIESFTTYKEALKSANSTFNHLTSNEKKKGALYIIKATKNEENLIDFENAVDKKVFLDYPYNR